MATSDQVRELAREFICEIERDLTQERWVAGNYGVWMEEVEEEVEVEVWDDELGEYFWSWGEELVERECDATLEDPRTFDRAEKVCELGSIIQVAYRLYDVWLNVDALPAVEVWNDEHRENLPCANYHARADYEAADAAFPLTAEQEAAIVQGYEALRAAGQQLYSDWDRAAKLKFDRAERWIPYLNDNHPDRWEAVHRLNATACALLREPGEVCAD